MGITSHQAKYFAYDLTKRRFGDSLDKLIPVLADSKVDLNPHQIEAALFAFKSPFSKGAILADEVGLGKTIEAGLVLSQSWAERKRKLLIIAPASLRKQWAAELAEKFHLPSLILETSSFNEALKQGHFNPFETDQIIIVSFPFARMKADYIRQTPWDLVVVDEAHRLRNVYKPDNKVAKSITGALLNFKKVLLTATPLQNSLLELYGLTSVIDGNIFGDLASFKARYARGGDDSGIDYLDLRERLRGICIRTLRRQVSEYINYTARHALTKEFSPYSDEQALYEAVTEYLQRNNLFALPNSQRQLITLIMFKLLSSSSFAIADTLGTLITRLDELAARAEKMLSSEMFAGMDDDLTSTYLSDDEFEDAEEDEEENSDFAELTPAQLEALRHEIEDLKVLQAMALNIRNNAKGDSLLVALEQGFEKMRELGAAQKAVIFTESRRTQEYVNRLLTEKGHNVVLFNGSNSDPKSNTVYREWLEKNKGTPIVSGSTTADKRAALVDYFRSTADILLATEAAAEGINLQFASLVVNFDLPWNPQRIEQRIGRCHRYGQKHDVVVVNFLNNRNAADRRVYQLLQEKFQLFDGVFGASDEVLGAIESGVDFEKRIAEIYQCCRTAEDINAAFDALQKELETDIGDRMKVTRQKLLENFDAEVHEKLKLNYRNSQVLLTRHEKQLWDTARFALAPFAEMNVTTHAFFLKKSPTRIGVQYIGLYSMSKDAEERGSVLYRVGHPLAQFVLETCRNTATPEVEIVFNLSKNGAKITPLESYVGRCGELALYNLTVQGIEPEDYLVFAAVDDKGNSLDTELCERLLNLPAQQGGHVRLTQQSVLNRLFMQQKEQVLAGIEQRNTEFFNSELTKLDKWAEDLKGSLEMQLKALDVEIKQLRAESHKTIVLADKVELETRIKEKQRQRNNLRQNLYEEQDKVDDAKEALLKNVRKRLGQTVTEERLFSIRWQIV